MSAPAPNDLALIEAFVNSFDLETGEEALTSPEALARGCTSAGWPDEASRPRRPRVRDRVREHLRALLLANNGGELDPAAPAALSAAADRARLTVALDEHGRATVTPAGRRDRPRRRRGCSASSPARRPTARGSG